ncbi:HutD/Ves family protein [Achromobacter denitrificans]
MMRVQRLGDAAPEPWKNGGGLTRTLARGEQWRVSLALIERDGPYSSFPDVQRLSRVLRGAGVVLRHGGVAVALEPDVSVHYDGAPAWQAVLADGPCEALNVMARAGAYRLSAQPVQPRMQIPAKASAVLLARGAPLRIDGAPLAGDEYAVFEPAAAPRERQVDGDVPGQSLFILIEPRVRIEAFV